jgi:hypothetical protein
MTPEQRKVSLHYEFLLTGVSDPRLTTEDVERVQRWLDDEERGVEIPLSTGTTTAEQFRLANELVTYYCRYRHNDWSEEWMRKHLTGESLGTYAGWLDDLVILCRSHHQGKAELINESFDPRPVGAAPAVIVHLRYLACVLRMADILEFDPERTPEVILRHREIPAGSLIYWHKDHGVSMIREDDRLSVSARPPTARLHRAIETMLDEIDHELQLCSSIAAETHFENCPNIKAKLPHRWGLGP